MKEANNARGNGYRQNESMVFLRLLESYFLMRKDMRENMFAKSCKGFFQRKIAVEGLHRTYA